MTFAERMPSRVFDQPRDFARPREAHRLVRLHPRVAEGPAGEHFLKAEFVGVLQQTLLGEGDDGLFLLVRVHDDAAFLKLVFGRVESAFPQLIEDPGGVCGIDVHGEGAASRLSRGGAHPRREGEPYGDGEDEEGDGDPLGDGHVAQHRLRVLPELAKNVHTGIPP